MAKRFIIKLSGKKEKVALLKRKGMKKVLEEFRLKNRNKKFVYKIAAIVAVIVSVGIFTVTFFSLNGKVTYLKQQKAEYSEQLDLQNEQNEKLSIMLESDNRDEYIEQKAREKGYVKSNEIVFYDVSSSK